MASRYGQYCPLSIATEILGERWTMLVVMQVIEGVTHFNDLLRALPRISPSTLSARLRGLEEAELLEKRPLPGGGGFEYVATQGGKELEPILCDLAYWAQRWGRDMETDDLDPEFLAWSMHGRMDTASMPSGRLTLEFEFTGVPKGFCRRFWILKRADDLDVCIKHPGYDVDLRVASDLQRFVETWRGFRSLEAELAAGRIRLEGPAALRRAFPRWLLLSSAAHVERRRSGRERTTWRRSAARRR